VTLSYYDEPTGETQIGPDTNTAADDNTNLTVDFGFRQLGAISDVVWIDADRDGIRDPDETLVQGVVVELLDASGEVVATATTDAQGRYLFDDLEPGEYSLQFKLNTLPKGYVTTGLNTGGDDTKDSDGDPVTGKTGKITVTPGVTTPNVALGIHEAKVDLKLIKELKGSLVAGKQATWVLTVSNQGVDPDPGPVVVTDTLPAALTFVSANGQGWGCTNTGQTVTCTTPGPLASKATAGVITIITTVKTSATGQVINSATVRTTAKDSNTANNTSSHGGKIGKTPPKLTTAGAAIGGGLGLGLGLIGVGFALRRTSRRRRQTTTT
jgi:uncharacterized repeat protein (TIGR01451 family)